MFATAKHFTLVIVLLHLAGGCCWHHAHDEEAEATASAADGCGCEAAGPQSARHSHRSDPPCHEGPCVVVVRERTTVAGCDSQVGRATPGCVAVSGEFRAALTAGRPWTEAALPSARLLRLQLRHGKLLI